MSVENINMNKMHIVVKASELHSTDIMILTIDGIEQHFRISSVRRANKMIRVVLNEGQYTKMYYPATEINILR